MLRNLNAIHKGEAVLEDTQQRSPEAHAKHSLADEMPQVKLAPLVKRQQRCTQAYQSL